MVGLMRLGAENEPTATSPIFSHVGQRAILKLADLTSEPIQLGRHALGICIVTPPF